MQSITLDSFTNKNNIKKIDLLKIDIETFEPQCIKGFLNTLASHKPTLLIEILNNEVANSVYELIKDLDYLYFDIDEKNGLKQTKKIIKSTSFNYLICQKDIAKKLDLSTF